MLPCSSLHVEEHMSGRAGIENDCSPVSRSESRDPSSPYPGTNMSKHTNQISEQNRGRRRKSRDDLGNAGGSLVCNKK